MLLILTFHRIGDSSAGTTPGEECVWTSKGEFEKYVAAAARTPDVKITFDDGFRSDVDDALPVLQEHGLRATFFVCAGRLGAPGFLQGSDLRTLVSAGMTVGSHGMNHVLWTSASDDELHAETGDARRRLEDVLGQAVTEAAIPFGAYDRRVIRALRLNGYEHVYTSDGGFTDTRRWMLQRNTIHEMETRVLVTEHGLRLRYPWWIVLSKRVYHRIRTM